MRRCLESIHSRFWPLPTMVLGAALVGGCGGDESPPPTPSLDAAPLILGHRGLPGLFPEETQPSYEAAADAGADSLELDLHMTKDCVLVARHNAWLSDNTNIADVAKTNPDVAARKRTVPGVMVNVAWATTADSGPSSYLSDLTDPSDPTSVLKSLIVDGDDHTNDWSITDFTVAELKQWIGGTTYDARDERPTDQNGKHPVVTFQEVIDIAVAKSKSTGRAISIYPEAKNPIWNNAQAIANGCGPAGSRPFEAALLAVLEDNKLNTKEAGVYVQSFDPESLKHLRSIGLQTHVVQLIDGNAVNYKTGDLIYNTDKASTFVDGRPYSWTLSGDPRYFGVMLTPAGLAEIKTYADGIGPWKFMVMTHKVTPWKEQNADGTPYTGALADVNSIEPNSVIADAHAAGLFVHAFTFRNEKKYLAGLYEGDPQAEYKKYFRAGLDGVFTDFAGTGVAARAAYLKEVSP